MKTLRVLVAIAALAASAAAQPPPIFLRVQESDGSPTGVPHKLQFTGCTLAYSGSTATVTCGGGVAASGDSATAFFPSGTLEMNIGGTGVSTCTAYDVVFAGTTATGAFQCALGLGSAGQVLTSSGAGALPSWGNVLVGGGADDADAGIVRASNNANIICSEKATTGTDSCLKLNASDQWVFDVTGTSRLTVAAGTLNYTASSNTSQEFTLDGTTWGPASQGSSAGWTFYAAGGSEDSITSTGYMVQNNNILGFNSGNSSSTDTKPQAQFKGGQSKTLTDASATAFVQLTMASNSTIGGTIKYQVQATAGGDYQSRSGIVPFAAVDKAGTITCTIGTVAASTEVVAVSAGTLTNTGFTCADAGSNILSLSANMDSSLSSPTDIMKWDAEVIGVGGTLVITPQ